MNSPQSDISSQQVPPTPQEQGIGDGTGDGFVVGTPSRNSSTRRPLDFGDNVNDDDGGGVDDVQYPPNPRNQGEESYVPSTPMVEERRGNDYTSEAPLTPLSDIEDDYVNNDDNNVNNEDNTRQGNTGGQQLQEGEERNNEDDDSQMQQQQRQQQRRQQQPPPLFEDGNQDHALIRGTDVHVPTAAAAFIDFLRNFKCLQSTNSSNNSDDDDDSVMSDEDQQAQNTRPLYLSRLESLLTRGVILTSDEDNGNETDAANNTGTTSSSGTASLSIDAMHLYFHSRDCQKFYHQLVAYPMEMVPLMDLLVQREVEHLANVLVNDPPDDMNVSMIDLENIPRVQVRPYNLKEVSNLRGLDPVSLDSLICVRGMVLRISSVIPDLKVAHFTCCVCGHNIQVTIDRGRISEPKSKCPQCNTNDTFQLMHNRSIFADKQLVRLQETPDEVPAGQTPASISTFCFDDLVDCVKPGDKVEITGVLRAQPIRVNPKITKIKSVYKTYVDVIHFKRVTGMVSTKISDNKDDNESGNQRMNNSRNGRGGGMKIRFTKERIKQLNQISRRPNIYEQLTLSIAPSIYELDNVKKGVLCMLFGGNSIRVKKKKQRRNNGDDHDDDDQDEDDDEQDEEGNHTLHKRADINILLCGDPGTSKSQLLSYVNKLSTRGIYTSGKGSSAVGLTASVVRDPETRDLVLESGALVLSDLGICAIDEFDKMSDATRSVLHEAMEQQTVSIAKAGIIATLNARTSILASANPTESRYNPNMSVVDNIKLPPTLLSRFDLIYLILDNPNVEYDRKLAKHLVGLYYETPNVIQPPLDQELLRDYIDYARENIFPYLSDEASEYLVQAYVQMRNPMSNSGAGSNKTISATPRQFESMIRISEALAKMRYGDTVTIADAKEAVRLMQVATQTAATDPRTGRIDMDMIATGRSAIDRQTEEELTTNIKQLLCERRGTRMKVRDITRQLLEIANITAQTSDVVNVLRTMGNDGVLQFNERAQTATIRAGVVVP